MRKAILMKQMHDLKLIVASQIISIQPLAAFGWRSQTAHRPGYQQLSSLDFWSVMSFDLYITPHSRLVYNLFVRKVAWFKSQNKYCIQKTAEALFLSNPSEPMTDLVLGRLVGIQGWDRHIVAPSNWHIDLDARAFLQAETNVWSKTTTRQS